MAADKLSVVGDADPARTAQTSLHEAGGSTAGTVWTVRFIVPGFIAPGSNPSCAGFQMEARTCLVNFTSTVCRHKGTTYLGQSRALLPSKWRPARARGPAAASSSQSGRAAACPG